METTPSRWIERTAQLTRRLARRALVPAAVALVLATTPPITAGQVAPLPGVDVDWALTFDLRGTSSGSPFDPPVIKVGFNPQPEPPKLLTRLDLTDPGAPMLLLPGQSNPPGGPPALFNLFLAVGVPGLPGEGVALLPAIQQDNPFWHVQAFMGVDPSPWLDIFFDFATDSGGPVGFPDLIDAFAFNPQPEPPAGLGGGLGLQFSFPELSTAIVTMRVLDAQRNQIEFERVPEPAASTLLALGLAGLVALRRARARRP